MTANRNGVKNNAPYCMALSRRNVMICTSIRNLSISGIGTTNSLSVNVAHSILFQLSPWLTTHFEARLLYFLLVYSLPAFSLLLKRQYTFCFGPHGWTTCYALMFDAVWSRYFSPLFKTVVSQLKTVCVGYNQLSAHSNWVSTSARNRKFTKTELPLHVLG